MQKKKLVKLILHSLHWNNLQYFNKVKELAFLEVDKRESSTINTALEPNAQKRHQAPLMGKFEFTENGLWFRANGLTGFQTIPKEAIDNSLLSTDFVNRLNTEYAKRFRERLGTLESIIGPLLKRVEKGGRFRIDRIALPDGTKIQTIGYASGKGFIKDGAEMLGDLTESFLNPKKLSAYQTEAIEFAYGINAQQLEDLLNDRLQNK